MHSKYTDNRLRNQLNGSSRILELLRIEDCPALSMKKISQILQTPMGAIEAEIEELQKAGLISSDFDYCRFLNQNTILYAA